MWISRRRYEELIFEHEKYVQNLTSTINTLSEDNRNLRNLIPYKE